MVSVDSGNEGECSRGIGFFKVDFIGSILAGRKIRSSLIARRSGTAAIKVIAFCFLIFCFSILGGVLFQDW
jgi:hypothetical protein